jgi:hypothetical protein
VYWLSALIILAFGAGLFSLDALGKYVLQKRGRASGEASRELR